MRKRHLNAIGFVVAAGLLLFSVPAWAAPRTGHHSAAPKVPAVSVTWANGVTMPFEAYRWDGALYKPLNRVYFLGFRRQDNSTDGSVWYYDVVAKTFTDTGVDMPVPVTNYQISPLTDATGALGFYIFGGRDSLGNIVNTVQAYFPATNTTSIISTDPWPGKTPSQCISLPAMGVATVANHAVVVGGLAFSANGCVDEQSAQSWIYFPKKAPGTRWKRGPNLNVARGYITTAVLGTTVYAIGGDTNVAGTLFASPTVESWLLPSGTWNDSGVADLPVSPGCDEGQAWGFMAGPLVNDVVLAGCGQWPSDLPDTWLYNSSSNSWSDVGAFVQSRRNHAGELVGSKMYVFGGVTANGGTVLTSTETGHAVAGRPGFARPLPRGGASGAATTN